MDVPLLQVTYRYLVLKWVIYGVKERVCMTLSSTCIDTWKSKHFWMHYIAAIESTMMFTQQHESATMSPHHHQ